VPKVQKKINVQSGFIVHIFVFFHIQKKTILTASYEKKRYSQYEKCSYIVTIEGGSTSSLHYEIKLIGEGADMDVIVW
jgi:hypothetical protein